jgi:hypothetical protein
MRLWKLVAMAVAGVALAAPVRAAQAPSPELSVEDVVRIQQLYSRYHWATDGAHHEAWARLFVADGEFEGGNDKAKGWDQLAATARKALGSPTARTPLHLQTNITFEASPEGARGGSYMLMVAPGEPGEAGKPAKPPTIVTLVIYEDVLVKTPEGWRFKSRKAHSKDIGLLPALLWPGAQK